MLAKDPILIVDDDESTAQLLEKVLAAAGLPAVVAQSGQEALLLMTTALPSLVLLDLMMPPPDGYALLRHIRSTPSLARLPVIAMTAYDSTERVQEVFDLGANDYVSKPFRQASLLARVRSQLQLRDTLERLEQRERVLQSLLELTQALASSLDIHDILATVVRRIAEVAHVDRCSIVLVGEDDHGFVVASSDDERLRNLPIDLSQYPEIRQSLTSGKPLVIRDVSEHPLLQVVRRTDRPMVFSSVALVPVIFEGRAIGVLFLRSRKQHAFEPEEMSFVESIANASAIAMRNARVLEQLKAETAENAAARVEAEHRMAVFQQYANFFESAADGIVVVRADGHILFANPRAREITGYSEADLPRLTLDKVLQTEERIRVLRLARGFREGIYPQGVDLRIRSGRGDEVVLSVNFSSVLRSENAVVVTFRDVTLERRTEVELKQTKEFLERVIESSVDAIVSADLTGKVLIFNSAAARIFGYPQHEVLGKMSVERLYAPGGARKVMQLIRSPQHGGEGRLEDYRVNMVDASGATIPVTISAALIYDGGCAIGSVGIFTDIRERLRMEARLVRTQEELREREKQSAVAQLAGATAHELNQPLTSIIGYATLLGRLTEPESQAHRAAEVLIGQAERMAEIVRKVGKLTHYETKSYVGGAQIVDLDRASTDLQGTSTDLAGAAADLDTPSAGVATPAADLDTASTNGDAESRR